MKQIKYFITKLSYLLLAYLLIILNISAQIPTPTTAPTTSPNPIASPTPNTNVEASATADVQPDPQIDQPVNSLNVHKWGTLSLFHGLPSNHVRAIAQDSDGVLWFGTEEGIAKYDGRRIQRIVADGLPSERIFALLTDKYNNLWIGTEKGVTLWRDNRFNPLPETADYPITAITKDENSIYISTTLGTIFICNYDKDKKLNITKIDGRTNPLLNIDPEGKTELPITDIIAQDGSLILATRGRGLLQYINNQIKEIYNRPRAYFVKALKLDNNGKLWFGAEASNKDTGLYYAFTQQQSQKIGAATGIINTMIFDSENDLWVGSNEHGVYHFQSDKELDHFTFENSSGGLSSNHIYSLFIDREGVIWVGTDRGVSRYDPNSPHAEKITEQSENNFVRTSFQSSNGFIWCGSKRGLFVREMRNSSWRAIEEFNNRTVYAINEDAKGHLLVGCASGFYISKESLIKENSNKDNKTNNKENKNSKKNKNNRPDKDINKDADKNADQDDPGDPNNKSSNQILTFTHIEKITKDATVDSIRSIVVFRGVVYLAIYDRGVERFENNQRTLVWPTNEPDNKLREVVSLYNEDNRQLWIGTAHSRLAVYDGTKVLLQDGFQILGDSAIWSVFGNENNGYWIATAKGLYLYDQKNLKQVLADLDVRALIPSGTPNTIWCGTAGNGLYKIAIDKLSGITTSFLDSEHGLPSDYIFALSLLHSEKSRSSLLIGTNKGLALYEPATISPLLRATRILGTRIYQPEELKEFSALEYPQNSLLLEVAATGSRTFPEQFQYLFLLMDEKRRVLKQRFSHEGQFTIEDLKPGRYRVEAHAYNNDLVISDPLAFSFTVASSPFPWSTLALSVLLSLSLSALWWGYHQNRKLSGTNQALATANKQLAATRLQLASETENERRRIARDLHDQTLSDLRKLMMLTDQIPKNSPDNNVLNKNALRNEIETISTEIRRICEDLSPSVLTNVGLTAALEWALTNAVAHMPPQERFEYEFICDDELEDRINFDENVQIQLYRVVQEAISNTCRHAKAKKVKLIVALTEDNLFSLKLIDDGCGFSSRRKDGRGLNNMRSRANMIEAEVDWQSRPAQGTTFTLSRFNTNNNKPDDIDNNRLDDIDKV